MNAICLVHDALHCGFLGAYGNTWMDTPAVDRLASQSCVFDNALIDSPQLDRLYRSYWQGLHALCARPRADERPTLAALLRAAGVATVLATDDRALAEHPAAVDFDEIVEIEPPWQPQVAPAIAQTHAAKCFAEAIAWLEEAREPFLLWCHFAGLATAWDAPAEFRRAAWAEGDPEPYAAADVPDRLLPDGFDPDEALSISQAYAGQVSVWDSCLGAFLEFVDGSSLAAETAVVWTAARGFPLAEHRRVGPCDAALYGELVHVPLMVRWPDARGAAERRLHLVEPSDLWATLLDAWPTAERPPVPTAASLLPLLADPAVGWRDRLCLAGRGSERAIRTPAWYLRSAAVPELFAKPDDRWEVNNVAVRCPEVVECLGDALTEFDQTVQHGRLADLPPLSAALVEGLD